MKHLCKCFLPFCVFGLLITPNFSFAQSQKIIDSLKQVITLPVKTTKQIDALNELAWIFRVKDFNQSLKYASLSITKATDIKYKAGLATAYTRKGLVFQKQGIYDSANIYYNKALKIEIETKHSYGIARSKNQLGIVLMLTQKYKEAIELFNESIEILESNNLHSKTATKKTNLATCYKNLGNFEAAIRTHLEAIDLYNKSKNKGQIGKSYLGLGVLYQRTNHYNTAYDYLQKALLIFKEQGYKLFLAKTYHELGFLYNNLENFDDAIRSYQNSLKLLKELKTTQKIQVTYNNLGHVYLKQSQLSKAKIWLDKGLELARQKKDMATLALVYNNLGAIEFKLGEYRKAIRYFNKSLALSNKFQEKYNKKNVLKNMGFAHARLGNYQKAFEYYRQYNQSKDSLETSFRQAMDLKDAYQKQKQQSEILKKNQTIQQKELARLKELSRRQQIFNYFLGVSLLLLVISVLAIVRNYQVRQRSKQRQDKIDELLDEQEFIALSKMIEGQEQERDRIAQDLHDRLGSMLSMVKLHFTSLETVSETAQIKEVNQYQKASQLLDNACEEVRKVAHDISSSVLRNFGLMPALFDLKDNIEESNSLKIDLFDTGFDDKRLSANYETQIYRIVQEMVSNVLKHANAQRLEIQLFWKEKGLHISAEDNGKGFNVQKLDMKKGMGLRGIESRVKGLDGEFQIDSTEGKGTTIMIDIPKEIESNFADIK